MLERIVFPVALVALIIVSSFQVFVANAKAGKRELKPNKCNDRGSGTERCSHSCHPDENFCSSRAEITDCNCQGLHFLYREEVRFHKENQTQITASMRRVQQVCKSKFNCAKGCEQGTVSYSNKSRTECGGSDTDPGLSMHEVLESKEYGKRSKLSKRLRREVDLWISSEQDDDEAAQPDEENKLYAGNSMEYSEEDIETQSEEDDGDSKYYEPEDETFGTSSTGDGNKSEGNPDYYSKKNPDKGQIRENEEQLQSSPTEEEEEYTYEEGSVFSKEPTVESIEQSSNAKDASKIDDGFFLQSVEANTDKIHSEERQDVSYAGSSPQRDPKEAEIEQQPDADWTTTTSPDWTTTTTPDWSTTTTPEWSTTTTTPEWSTTTTPEWTTTTTPEWTTTTTPEWTTTTTPEWTTTTTPEWTTTTTPEWTTTTTPEWSTTAIPARLKVISTTTPDWTTTTTPEWTADETNLPQVEKTTSPSWTSTEAGGLTDEAEHLDVGLEYHQRRCIRVGSEKKICENICSDDGDRKMETCEVKLTLDRCTCTGYDVKLTERVVYDLRTKEVVGTYAPFMDEYGVGHGRECASCVPMCRDWSGERKKNIVFTKYLDCSKDWDGKDLEPPAHDPNEPSPPTYPQWGFRT